MFLAQKMCKKFAEKVIYFRSETMTKISESGSGNWRLQLDEALAKAKLARMSKRTKAWKIINARRSELIKIKVYHREQLTLELVREFNKLQKLSARLGRVAWRIQKRLAKQKVLARFPDAIVRWVSGLMILVGVLRKLRRGWKRKG